MPTKPENVAGIAPRPMAQAVPVEPERAVFVRPLPGVNGGQEPRKSGAIKKSGTKIAGLEPGQERATARRSEPLTRRRHGYAGAWL